MNESSWLTNGMLLHAGGVKTPKGALLFMGPSGAGKSTICKLLSEHFEVIADDVVHVSWRNGVGWVADDGRFYANDEDRRRHTQYIGGPRESAATRIYTAMRLHQAEQPAMVPLSPRVFCSRIMDGVLEVAGQSMNYSCIRAIIWFHIAAGFAREIRGWNLYFPNKASTFQFLDAFIAKGVPSP